MIESLYPEIKSSQVAYISGCPKENWEYVYTSIYVMACEFKIPNLIIYWSEEKVIRVQISDFNWRQYSIQPTNFRELLTFEYGIGQCVALVGNSVRKTVESYPYPVPYQMYLNSAKESKLIPHFNADIVPAFDVTKDKQVFAHACNSLNLARFDSVNYIKRALLYATANGMKGVVFHCGSHVNTPLNDCLNMLGNNIVSGIRAAKFSPEQQNTAKFILETPTGRGTEILALFEEFVNFCNNLMQQCPDIAPFFSICVDTCHVHQFGYAPHYYLTEMMKYHSVALVHFNDSENGWCCRKDRHSRPGEGHIPWIFLLMVAYICKVNSIPAVFEN